MNSAVANHLNTTPTAVSVAGSDPSAGAGIQADLKTFSALGVYGCTVITALTAQNTQTVTNAWAVPVGAVAEQITTLFNDVKIHAAKTGMLFNASIINEVVDALAKYPDLPLVCDPVMVSTSGARLLDNDAIDTLRKKLIPRACIITPNLREAAALLDEDVATSEKQIVKQAEKLLDLGVSAVLITGGDFQQEKNSNNQASDVFVWHDGNEQSCEIFRTPKIHTKNTHGTGCTLSAAIAAGLAKGHSLLDAIGLAKEYVTYGLAHADELSIGGGHGPLQHFYR